MAVTDIQRELISMADAEYREFSASLMPTVDKNKVIGVRIPMLRRYAKRLEDYDSFLSQLPHQYYEEDNLHAFLIERERDFDRCIELLDAFLPYVDNWATCDSMKPKVLKTELDKLLVHIKRWINSKKVYAVRYGINLLMSYYLEDNFCDSYHHIVADVKSDEYYINMMRAWYFATALAKRWDDTLPYITNHRLDSWTHNKTIQKAIESYRVPYEHKAYLKSLKERIDI